MRHLPEPDPWEGSKSCNLARFLAWQKVETRGKATGGRRGAHPFKRLCYFLGHTWDAGMWSGAVGLLFFWGKSGKMNVGRCRMDVMELVLIERDGMRKARCCKCRKLTDVQKLKRERCGRCCKVPSEAMKFFRRAIALQEWMEAQRATA